MLDLLGHLFNQMLLAACCLSLVLVFLSIAGLLRLLPALMPYFRLLLRVFLILSVRLYRVILTNVAPVVAGYLNVDVLSLYPRIIASALLSLVFGLVLIALTQAPVTIWNAGVFILHGVVVGFVWDGFQDPDDLLLGVNAR